MTHDKLMSTPEIIRDFLIYNQTIRNKSSTSIDEYYRDLTTFFRYIKMHFGICEKNNNLSEIDIDYVNKDIVKKITLYDIHSFLVFCSQELDNKATTRARKASTIRIFFKYLKNQAHIIDSNPAELLETPKTAKTLPKHLSLEDSIELLYSVDGPNSARDFCILTIFLNCGLRLSEVCSLNVNDVRGEKMIVTGKGNKQRVVYINSATRDAIDSYLPHRNIEGVKGNDRDALFISRNKRRISNKTVQHIVYKSLENAGLSGMGLSAHKLRHTAATLMYQQGNVDVRTLQVILGHENLGTTQIYTHVSDAQSAKAVEANPLSTIKRKK